MVKIGILGTGFGITHLKCYKNIEDAEVVIIFGRNQEKLKEIENIYNVKVTHNLDDVMLDPSIELIDICLPTHIHKEFVIKAFENGKHVICELPIAYSMEDALKMCEYSKKFNRIFMIAQASRFDSGYRYLQETIHSNRLGKLKILRLYRQTPPIWGTTDKMMIDLLIHDFDYAVWMVGKPNFLRSHVLRNKDDHIVHAINILYYPNAQVIVEGSNILPLAHPFTVGYEATFEKGGIFFTWQWKDNRPNFIIKEYNSEKEITPEIEDRYPYEEEMKYAVDCVKNKIYENLISADNMVLSLELALNAIDDAKKEAPISIN